MFTKSMRGDFLAGPLSAADFAFYPSGRVHSSAARFEDPRSRRRRNADARASRMEGRIERLPYLRQDDSPALEAILRMKPEAHHRGVRRRRRRFPPNSRSARSTPLRTSGFPAIAIPTSRGADCRRARSRWRSLPRSGRSIARRRRQPGRPRRSGRRCARVDFFHWLLIDLPPDAAADRTRRVLGWRHRARQAGPARAARRAAGHQRLHGMVRRRQGHGRQLFRLRRTVPAMERRDPPSLHVHAVRARRRAPRGAGVVRGCGCAQCRSQVTCSRRRRSPGATRSTRQCGSRGGGWIGSRC